MKKLRIFLVLLLCTNLFAYSPKFSFLGSSDVFKLEPIKDSIILGTGLSLNAANIICFDILDLNHKEYSPSFNKSTINKFDKFFMQDYSKTLDLTGDVLVGLSFASPFLFFASNKDYIPTIFVMYIETLALSKGTTDLLKEIVQRKRPCMYYQNYPTEFVTDGDWNKSWPSGHTTYTFASAAFMSYTFCKLNPDSKLKYLVTAGTYSIALTTAIFRVASGNHFPTDVLTGALFGTTWGFLVPFLHQHKSLPISLSPNGINLCICF